MNKKILMIFAFGMFFQSVFSQTPALNKLSLNMSLRTDRGQAEWRWRPNVNFDLNGEFDPDSTKVKVELTDSAGKNLFAYECEIKGRSFENPKWVEDCGNELERDLATTHTGVTKFRILFGNKAKGAVEELYSGSFKIDKFLFNPANNPAFNKNFYYYIKYDWRLPFAYVGYWKDENTPQQLYTLLWVKGDYLREKPTAQLFYKGKMVAEDPYNVDLSYGVEEAQNLRFDRLSFQFQAAFEKTDSESYNRWWKLYENPGEYEIKLIRKGQVARSLKFQIGSDGKIVDNGIGKKNKLAQNGMIYIPEVLGDTDGTIDRALFADGWWGNPIIK